jgi:hypothetical protein
LLSAGPDGRVISRTPASLIVRLAISPRFAAAWAIARGMVYVWARSTHAYVDMKFPSKSGGEKNEKVKHVIADVLLR